MYSVAVIENEVIFIENEGENYRRQNKSFELFSRFFSFSLNLSTFFFNGFILSSIFFYQSDFIARNSELFSVNKTTLFQHEWVSRLYSISYTHWQNFFTYFPLRLSHYHNVIVHSFARIISTWKTK